MKNNGEPVYAFLKLDGSGVKIVLSGSLDEFRTFCHYGFFPDERDLETLEETGVIGWTVNDDWYYVMKHGSWDSRDRDLDIQSLTNIRSIC